MHGQETTGVVIIAGIDEWLPNLIVNCLLNRLSFDLPSVQVSQIKSDSSFTI